MSYLFGCYASTPTDKSEIDQRLLNIVNKTRSNPLKWNGQFSPQLVETLLGKYASPGDILFDPFLGSGTLLAEAGLAGFASMGTEINPAAFLLSKLYQFINVPLDARQLLLDAVSEHLEYIFPLPMFAHGNGCTQETTKDKLTGLLSEVKGNLQQCDLINALIVLLDLRKPDLMVDKVFMVWRKITKLVLSLPFSEMQVTMFNADARETPLTDASVDVVLTSPPYINVFNYHQQYRDSVEFLEWDLLQIAKSEIGSNRKHRGNRFLTVVQYCLDMAMTFQELTRLTRPDGRLIFVVGRESKVLGVPIYNGELVAEVAHRVWGLNLILKQERVFQNRFGQMIFEDILHFSALPKKLNNASLSDARQVACDVLVAAGKIAPEKPNNLINIAMGRANIIQPSPIHKCFEEGVKW